MFSALKTKIAAPNEMFTIIIIIIIIVVVVVVVLRNRLTPWSRQFLGNLISSVSYKPCVLYRVYRLSH
jgi:cell shape-determining protein MreC